MTPIYILLEIHPSKKPPQDLTDLIADRVFKMDFIDKHKELAATILTKEQVDTLKEHV